MPTTHERLGCLCGRRTANPEHRHQLHEVAAGSDAGQQFLAPIVPETDNLDLDLASLTREARRAAALEHSWNAAAATDGERRQGQDGESRAASD
jgi:hypothetical protein